MKEYWRCWTEIVAFYRTWERNMSKGWLLASSLEPWMFLYTFDVELLYLRSKFENYINFPHDENRWFKERKRESLGCSLMWLEFIIARYISRWDQEDNLEKDFWKGLQQLEILKPFTLRTHKNILDFHSSHENKRYNGRSDDAIEINSHQ